LRAPQINFRTIFLSFSKWNDKLWIGPFCKGRNSILMACCSEQSNRFWVQTNEIAFLMYRDRFA
jgi:hypothetical protein